MRKTKPLSLLIQDPVYDRKTLFILGKDLQFAKKAYKTHLKDEAPESVVEFYDKDVGSFGRTIWQGDFVIILVWDVETSVICHECFHAVEYHFSTIGLPHSEDSREAWAYYLQFLVKEITSRIVLK